MFFVLFAAFGHSTLNSSVALSGDVVVHGRPVHHRMQQVVGDPNVWVRHYLREPLNDNDSDGSLNLDRIRRLSHQYVIVLVLSEYMVVVLYELINEDLSP